MKNRTGFFAYLAIASCLGIAVSRSGLHWGPLSLLVVFYVWIYLHDKKPHRLLLLSLLFSTAFYGYMNMIESQNVSVHMGSDTRISGIITTSIHIDGNKASFEMKSDQKETMLVEYFLQEQQEISLLESLQIGELCNWQGVLTSPQPATNPHAFDYKNYLYEQKKHWIFSLDRLPESCAPGESISILKELQKYRDKGIKTIDENMDPVVASFMVSLIFGDRRYLDRMVLEAYQQLGLIHLLAISGLHVGIITSAAFYTGIRLGLTRQSVNILLILLLPFYVILAGGAPSVMRAATMTAVALVLLLFKKKIFSIDTIGLACIFVLLLNPYYLYHIGFQLSFSVSMALILTSRKISSLNNGLLQIFYVSIIAQVASLPLLLFHFYQFSIWSPFLNIIFVPFFSLFVLPSAFILFFTMLFYPSLLPLLVPLFAFPLKLMNSLAVWFASIPFGTLVFGKPFIGMMGLLVSFTALFFYLWEKGRLPVASAMLVGCLCFQWCIPYINPYGKVVVVDIGQGDAIFIRLPFNKGTYLIDTGGTFPFPKEEWKDRKREYNSGTDVLLPFLKAEGVRKLDKLLLTHGDYDHIGNVASLWGHVKVSEVVVPLGFGGSGLEEDILLEAEDRGAKIQTAVPNTGWEVDSASFLYLHPAKAYENKNEGSIALYAIFGARSWLFTGDMESEGEREVLLRYPNMKVDVLKAGHHGSKTSTGQAFVERLKPDIAIISAGRNNRFGHPHQEVLDRLERSGAMVYRTDRQGAIIFEFTHRGGTFSTVLP
ncbi:DNA internalization-related competence protein ComEC/Rec2 [Sutcliffiella horikoshii]|uniref:DNA internalization-related competence protein ComEC/Rec2 n=1 Tax=Sutcliffiella horikoshii TaxID=79883 RepID=UPI001EED60AB|nr:DNA internalization-related competence protein ComEC/Rec2 [Sutcliffiella horikoshii]